MGRKVTEVYTCSLITIYIIAAPAFPNPNPESFPSQPGYPQSYQTQVQQSKSQTKSLAPLHQIKDLEAYNIIPIFAKQ
jgi:hypothetical protein